MTESLSSAQGLCQSFITFGQIAGDQLVQPVLANGLKVGLGLHGVELPEAVDRSLERFVDHCRQVTGKQAYSRDWQARARLWISDDARRRTDRAIEKGENQRHS